MHVTVNVKQELQSCKVEDQFQMRFVYASVYLQGSGLVLVFDTDYWNDLSVLSLADQPVDRLYPNTPPPPPPFPA